MALDKKDIEIIVYNYFRQQFVIKDVQWTPPHNRSTQTEERNITRFVDALNQLTSNFRSSEGFSQLHEKLETVIPSLDHYAADRFDEAGYVVFSGIAEHLCAEGIRWSHILTLFVFTFELANEYLQIKDDLTIVESIANWLILYVSERLLEWINNHGGSNGLVEYSNHSSSSNNFTDLRFWKTAFLATGIFALISFSMHLLNK
ncbi:uncharacterized protein LOC107368503 [Tetranychus urticae]|uniref:Bcl-2 Bcl-2 homology region 1-3 domain-containing protein n=1 Tax=Tetranychus urticae TaxID=32264 RepID=T1KYB0_TETUR|nr:uncharacterized protein LOC107368503 [Tetranychus urticae]